MLLRSSPSACFRALAPFVSSLPDHIPFIILRWPCIHRSYNPKSQPLAFPMLWGVSTPPNLIVWPAALRMSHVAVRRRRYKFWAMYSLAKCLIFWYGGGIIYYTLITLRDSSVQPQPRVVPQTCTRIPPSSLPSLLGPPPVTSQRSFCFALLGDCCFTYEWAWSHGLFLLNNLCSDN